MSTEHEGMKSFCNKCSGEKNHIVEAKVRRRVDHDSNFSTTYFYYILKCAGCEDVSFRTEEYFSEDQPWDPEDEWIPGIKCYPPRVARPVPKWFEELDDQISDILSETYAALHVDSRALATMGARTALERVMLTKITDRSTFSANVDEFIRQGFMAANLKEPLVNALDAGSASAHRAYTPSREEIANIFDIVEGIIHATCIMPQRAKAVGGATPPRPPFKK
jgi:hypothetical protein